MKAMILAAGLGERMRPLTEHTPKPMLKAGGKPLIEHHLEKLAMAGFKDVVINVSWLALQITEFAGDGAQWGLRITYSHEETPLETAGGIRQALPKLTEGRAPFAVINADIWTDLNFERLHTLPGAALAHLFLVDNPPHHPNGDFILDEPSGLVGLPSEESSTLTFSGVSVLSPDLFSAANSHENKLGILLRTAITERQVSGEHIKGRWYDIGTPARLTELNRLLG